MIFNHRARVMAMPVADLALGLQDRQPPRGSPQPGANEIRVRIANLINNSYGKTAESGLLGPVRLVRFR